MSDRRALGWAGTALAPAMALLTAALLGRAWSACDVGTNNAANGTFLLLLFVPALTLALLLLWLASVGLLGKHPLICAMAGGALVLTASWCAISLLWGGTTYYCPSGVPPWWPGVVPAPGF
ncbi:hypothetical protein [Streptomyces sp. NPDC096323]|uniref:hypothetical protein n=1 Tax=Streptomyces sp. NPDC096323 TaxID=3155822 RepID=UPI003329E8C5